MSTINITDARKDLYNLIENANQYNEPTLIVGKLVMYKIVKIVRMWAYYEK